MNDGLRKSGIESVGDVPWGTHLCMFYQTRVDLLELLVPYFRAGLENNEFCMWVTSEPLSVEDADQALRQAVDDYDKKRARGQIEIVPHTDWYLKDDCFDLHRVFAGWITKLENALEQGFDGLRATGNTAWLESADWAGFTEYEEELERSSPIRPSSFCGSTGSWTAMPTLSRMTCEGPSRWSPSPPRC